MEFKIFPLEIGKTFSWWLIDGNLLIVFWKPNNVSSISDLSKKIIINKIMTLRDVVKKVLEREKYYFYLFKPEIMGNHSDFL